MANPAPVRFSFDPTVPLGSESLRTGPARIKQIPAGILDLLGFLDTAVAEGIYSPIQAILNQSTPLNPGGVQLQAWNDPEDPLSYATKRYADRRTIAIAASSVNNQSFTATVADFPTNWVPDPNAIYLFTYTGGAYNGMGATLQINTAPAVPIVRMDGSFPLASADLLPGTTYPLAYDVGSASFRILGFVGGTLSEPTFATDPTMPQEVATANYVANGTTLPVRTPAPGEGTFPGGTPFAVITVPPITVPGDGSYLVFVTWNAYLHIQNGPVEENHIYGWVQDQNSLAFAVSSFVIQNDNHNWDAPLNAAGYSPAKYAANSTVNLVLMAASPQDLTVHFNPHHDPPPLVVGQGLDTSIVVNLQRTQF